MFGQGCDTFNLSFKIGTGYLLKGKIGLIAYKISRVRFSSYKKSGEKAVLKTNLKNSWIMLSVVDLFNYTHHNVKTAPNAATLPLLSLH